MVRPAPSANAQKLFALQQYDRGGRIQSIFGNRTGGDPNAPDQPVHTDYVKHVGYDEFDQKRRTVAGNGIETKFDYDPAHGQGQG